MPKHEEDDRIWKKLKKLEKKLKRRRRHRRSRSGSESRCLSQSLRTPVDVEIMELSEHETTTETNTGVHDLEDHIMCALGSAATTDKIYADEIHPELVKRVENILSSGIDVKIKEEIFKKHNIPKNVLLLDAPKLNSELVGLLAEPIKQRDKRVEERQQQLGIALSMTLTVVNKLLHTGQQTNYIEILTDVSRLLSDLHYEDTVTRRKLISINLDKNVAKAIDSTKRDSFLFSEKFNENVKSANAIKKAAPTILKKPIIPNKPSQPKPTYKFKENFPPPSRGSRPKQGRGGRYPQRSTGRQHQVKNSTNKSYRHKYVRQT